MPQYEFFAQVELKPDISDSPSMEIHSILTGLLSTDDIYGFRVGKFYKVGMDEENIEEAKKHAEDFLKSDFVNPTLQTIDISEDVDYIEPEFKDGSDVYGFRVFIERKDSDENGQDLSKYHTPGLTKLHTGDIYRMEIKADSREDARKIVDESIEKLLLNETIHEAYVRGFESEGVTE